MGRTNKNRGLTKLEVVKARNQFGYNEIISTAKATPFQIFLRQIKSNFIIYLLFFAAVASLAIGKSVTGYVILVIIGVVIFSGFLQEYRAERTIQSLKLMIMPVSTVRRNGEEVEIPSREIVPGDIIILRSGEKVPADCVVLEEKHLRINESVLTGESQEVGKSPANALKGQYEPEHLIYMGTHLVNGRCEAQVLHSGMNTEFGKITGLITGTEKELPLQRKVNSIARYMTVVAITVSSAAAVILFAQADDLSRETIAGILTVLIALSVSAFPEGFPVVLTSTLAFGAHRMAKQNAVVNRMSIIETLGETTVICSDKTGTITKGEMTATKLLVEGKEIDIGGIGYESTGQFTANKKPLTIEKNTTLFKLLRSAVFCNDARIQHAEDDHIFEVKGSGTEGALLIMAAKAGVYADDSGGQRVEEVPFDSERKMMSVLYRHEKGSNEVYVKGAWEVVLDRCTSTLSANKKQTLSAAQKKAIEDAAVAMTRQQLRVLALASKPVGKDAKAYDEKNLTFLGLVGLYDPPREGVAEAVRHAHGAGVATKMITGDNPETAKAIALQVGIKGRAITGQDLANMSDEELEAQVADIAVFARVKPEDKLRIIQALKNQDEVVTMTGDGVNDAPALKEAHVGVAMGINGTDVSKDSADLTLKDDNYVTIVNAIKEGRTIFNNVRKFVTYQLSDNFAELFVIFFGILLGLPLPLLALQVLFLNLVTDNMPAITLGFNPPSKDIMAMPARKRSAVLTPDLLRRIFLAGSLMGVTTLGMFWLHLHVFDAGIDVARTAALLTLICFEIANAFNFRSLKIPVHRMPFLANPYLVVASVASLLFTVLVVYTPLSTIFDTAPVGVGTWLLAAISSLSILVVFDTLKVIGLRKDQKLARAGA